MTFVQHVLRLPIDENCFVNRIILKEYCSRHKTLFLQGRKSMALSVLCMLRVPTVIKASTFIDFIDYHLLKCIHE